MEDAVDRQRSILKLLAPIDSEGVVSGEGESRRSAGGSLWVALAAIMIKSNRWRRAN